MSKTIKSAETVETEDDQDEPILMEFTSATSYVTQSEVASSADIEEIRERRRRERKEQKQLWLETPGKTKAILPPSPQTSSPPAFSKPIPSIASDDSEIRRLMEEPLEPHFPILPTMDDFDKLTEDATLKYKRFMDMIASGRAELDQMKIDIVDKITVHESVITDLMADIDGSSKNARILSSELNIVWNNCQGIKIQMSELLDSLKLEFNLMKEQSVGNVEGVRSLTYEMMRAIEGKWKEWENELVKSVHEQMEHGTSELRGSLLFTDGRVNRVEELVPNTRDDGKTWMNYCRDIRNHFPGLDNGKEKRLRGLEMNYQSKVLAQELLIKKMAERMDRLEEIGCKCGDKRKRSQEEYKTPSPNLELITDVIRDNNETDWNKEDSPTPAPETSKNREKKRPCIETISPESTPEPAPRTKDKKTPDVELFDGNAAKFKEFLSKLETYFRMWPESYPKKDFNGKILYTSMRLTGSAANWWMANEKKLDTSIPGY